MIDLIRAATDAGCSDGAGEIGELAFKFAFGSKGLERVAALSSFDSGNIYGGLEVRPIRITRFSMCIPSAVTIVSGALTQALITSRISNAAVFVHLRERRVSAVFAAELFYADFI